MACGEVGDLSGSRGDFPADGVLVGEPLSVAGGFIARADQPDELVVSFQTLGGLRIKL